MFPTRARALFSSQLRRQTAAPGAGSSGTGGGKFDPKTPAGQNNMLLAAAAAVTLIGGSYYMGFWGVDVKDKAKDAASTVKRD
ncbi:hypothetical protein DFH06DRAFT_1470310 [Mycena polygramma]|nr:hypothetical protein DFH06DRAFT_1470310 [Mycena polygramma]